MQATAVHVPVVLDVALPPVQLNPAGTLHVLTAHPKQGLSTRDCEQHVWANFTNSEKSVHVMCP